MDGGFGRRPFFLYKKGIRRNMAYPNHHIITDILPSMNPWNTDDITKSLLMLSGNRHEQRTIIITKTMRLITNAATSHLSLPRISMTPIIPVLVADNHLGLPWSCGKARASVFVVGYHLAQQSQDDHEQADDYDEERGHNNHKPTNHI